ncbi:MAG: cupin-like domain-containing protein [bacterium]
MPRRSHEPISPIPPRGERAPRLLPGLAADWPAVTRWTPDRLAEIAGAREVEVVVGERESHAGEYRTVPLAEVFRGQAPERAPDPPLYLKEFDLLAELPALAADVDLTRLARPGHRGWHYSWISHAGARTGYHYDLLDNVLTQIRGEKRVTVVAPAHTPHMYVSDKFDEYAVLSEVDGFAPDLTRHPRFAKARAAEQVFELGPGDGIFIPQGWWHRVESLSASISLSGFMGNRWDALKLGPYGILQWLHRRGLYKAGRCACHRPRGAS